MTAAETIVKQLGDIEFPFFVVHGTADKTIPLVASEKLFAKSKTAEANKKFTKFEGGCHDLLHDPDTSKVVADIIAWVETKFQ
jgi:esterase/lipase